MPTPLSGPGIGLTPPQQLYPANLTNGEVTTPTNTFTLAPGEALPIPAGRWLIDIGKYGSLQYLDPVTTSWTLLRDNVHNASSFNIWSDGFNVRIANLTGCAVGAVVTNGGNGAYVESTTTVTPSTGNSTWQPIVGGAINTSVSVTAAGSGYGIAPLVFIDAPPAPGVQATGYATLVSGSVTSITVDNQGAGYATAPSITILPNPADPNIATSITAATATCSLTGAGSVTAIICTNSGAPVANSMTLTITGGGASATATPLFLQTITSVTSVSSGAGYGTTTMLTTSNGYNNVSGPAFTNPLQQLYNFVPRPAFIPLTLSSGSITSATSIIDGGLFLTAPAPLPITNGIVTSIASLTFVLGSSNTAVRLQQVA